MTHSFTRRVTYPFFLKTAELADFLSTSEFDSSASSTTTESFLLLSESKPIDTDSLAATIDFANDSGSEKQIYDSDSTLCKRDSWADDQCDQNSNTNFDFEISQQLTQTENLRRPSNKRSSKESRNAKEITRTNPQRENPSAKVTSKRLNNGTCVDNISRSLTKHLVSGKVLISTQNPQILTVSPITCNYEFIKDRKIKSMNTNRSLKRVYDSYLQRNHVVNPIDLIERFGQYNTISDSDRKPKKTKYTLEKSRIKCLRNHVKKDILGDHYNFLQTPIDSDLSTITSIDLENNFDFFADKPRAKADKELTVPKQLKEGKHKNGRQLIRKESTDSVIHQPIPENQAQRRSKPTRRGMPSIAENESSGLFEFKDKKNNMKQPQLKTHSESSILTMVKKRNIKETNINASLVESFSNRKVGFPWSNSDERNYPYYCNNFREIDIRLRKSKDKPANAKISILKRKQEAEIELETNEIDDTCVKTTHDCDYTSCIRKKKDPIKPADQKKMVRFEEDIENNREYLKKMKQKSSRPRVVLNTLHINDRYLLLQCQPQLDQMESGIFLESIYKPKKPKSCPPDQSFSSTTDKVCKQSLEKSETSTEESRTRLLKNINEMISPLKNGAGEVDNKRDSRRVMNHIERKQTLLNCKLVNKGGEGSEDIFKSYCDVYYVNKARNFKRKKCLTKLDKGDRCNPWDDVFNKDNCQTVYVNKARNFVKNVSK